MISKTLIKAGQDILKGLVRFFTENEVNEFKNLYGTNDPTITIEVVIDNINPTLIEFAILHCEDVLKKCERPYIFKSIEINIKHSYNRNYGDHKECKCGHDYHRHFDSYEDMEVVGCKYCQCFLFEEKIV